ncbi:MAG: hypothetical protein ACHQHO_10710 [Solirubrobacterales bacterium]
MADFAETPRGGMGHEQFFYPATPSVFFGRTGWGPLIVSLDTDLLIHLAQNLEEVGGSFGFDGHGFMPEVWDDPVRALHDIFLLWCWRDVRLFVPPEQMDDGELTADRERSRQSILDAFSEDFWQRGGFERSSSWDDGEQLDTGMDLVAPREWRPPSWRRCPSEWTESSSGQRSLLACTYSSAPTDTYCVARRISLGSAWPP